MHKLTAALLAAFIGTKRFASNVAARLHKFLIDLHVANLQSMVARAEARVKRFFDVAAYHRAAYAEATTNADEAARSADAVKAQAAAEAANLGATLSA